SSPSSLPPATYHNYTSVFSFDLDEAVHPAWMARIPDHVSLASLSIPGTHDTMTFDLVDNEIFQCQNHHLGTQLRSGLRYFDIRGRLITADIGIFHGHVYTGYTFQDVLLAVFAFLDENPSEGIVMRIKQEGSPLKHKYNITFEEAFNYYRLKNPATAPGCDAHLLYPWPTTSRMVPTMGELRSKILILYEFPTVPTTSSTLSPQLLPKAPQTTPPPPSTTTTSTINYYGIPWTSPHIVLEDLWIILSPELLERKWDAIRQNLVLAGASPDDGDVLFLSHLSASVGVLPIEAAAGPLPERTNGSVVDGMNERTTLWLEAEEVEGYRQGGRGKTGVIMGDFMGKRLVESVLRRN
ncbi:phospholipase C, partial [Coniella lustricola]